MALALLSSGLSTQTQTEIFDEYVAKLQATFGVNINVTTSSNFGQQTNIQSEFLALAQQVLLGVYRSMDPNAAKGTALDARAALTGSVRKGATSSVVDGLLEFSGPGTTIDGDLIQHTATLTQWQVTGGPYSDTGGPYPEFVDATYQAVDTGPQQAIATSAWTLITVVAGLTEFTNPADDADLGRNQESDPDFRIRRQTELFSQGQGPFQAIKGVVSKVSGVETVRVYHNPAINPFDTDGIPFKAFNVVVETLPSPPSSALQQTIFDAIWSATGGGGQAFGTDFSGTVVDVEGQTQPSAFDLIDEVPIFVAMTISTAGTEQPITPNMKEVVEAKILETALVSFNGIGQNQIGFEYSAIVAALQASEEITGAVTVAVSLSRVAIGGPFLDPVEIAIRERPTFDSVNIVVTVT